jgi:serine protease Do
MKSKISPTSPKSKIESKTEVENLYQDSLTKIEKPEKKSASGFLWYLFFVVIIGFLSGLLALLVVLAYGPEIPYLNKILNYNTSLNNIITSRKSIQTADGVIKKVTTDNAAAIVTIFDKKTPDQNLSSSYKINESRGSGFILTADGYIVTSRDVASTTNNLVIIDNDAKLYEVNKVIFDPSSSMAFLKIDAASLKTISLVSDENLSVSDNIIILQKSNFGQTPLAVKASISSLDYTSGESLRSSSEFFRSIALSETLPGFFQKGVAFTVDGEAVGMVIGRDSITTVVPFYYIKNIMSQVLSGENPLRPTLGVNYFNLADLVGLSETMSQGYFNGALIYSDQQEARPSLVPKGPAEKAGLEERDIITAVDGHKIDSVNDLSDYILDHKVGDLLSLTVAHKGVEIEKKVTLEEFTNK